MKKTILTKNKIAHSLKTLMLTKEFKKITTEDISHTAGIRRQTFYNHFLDKYQVIEWIFTQELNNYFNKMPKPQSPEDILVVLLTYLEDEKVFYQKAFEITGQNAFSDCFEDCCLKILQYCYHSFYPIPPQKDHTELVNQFLIYHTLAFSHFVQEKIHQEHPLIFYQVMLTKILENQFQLLQQWT